MTTNVLSPQDAVTPKQILLEYIRISFGEDATTVLPKDAELPKDSTDVAISAGKYTCSTEQARENHPGALVVGLAFIPRWVKGSVVKWAVKSTGWPTPGHGIISANRLKQAAEEWNSHNIGVQFQWVDDLEEACFVLQYAGTLGSVLASAFFPNEALLNAMNVYEKAFENTQVEILKNVFLHELGHVLGFRHEFALDIGPRFEGGAVPFLESNPKSVMSYVFPPMIQDSDVKSAKAFYNWPVNKKIGFFDVTEYHPM
jgi:hypothetical protein